MLTIKFPHQPTQRMRMNIKQYVATELTPKIEVKFKADPNQKTKVNISTDLSHGLFSALTGCDFTYTVNEIISYIEK